eukprot:CAMPEP_0170493084 /NCGR_PEP_ID=MMETSP0208-20121228/13333_1 /TAXON_ID=197538 /ORGANISM="Strombidium inclinatum, Strain S3" /LENGTH=48 /DNA_ID= /DNA_START= /DNA_END= /DNA_ORIENTATION=
MKGKYGSNTIADHKKMTKISSKIYQKKKDLANRLPNRAQPCWELEGDA